jgi:hypothetical protein
MRWASTVARGARVEVRIEQSEVVMAAKFRPRLTYANVVSTLCLFIVLGGTSYGISSGTIGSREIKNNGVRSKDIHNNDVRSGDIRNGTVQGTDVKADTLTGGDVNESTLGKVPSAAAADTAANASTLGGRTAADLKLSCPAGTTLFANLCFEATTRPAQDLFAASRTCALAGRRLPSVGELDAYGNVFGTGGTEVTSNYYIEESASAGIYHFFYVGLSRSTSGSGGSSGTDSSTSRVFRCVIPPAN